MRKKLLVVVVGLILCLALSGCSARDVSSNRLFSLCAEAKESEPEIDPEAAEFYTALLVLVADYQSYAWDGELIQFQDGNRSARISHDYLMVSMPEISPDTWKSTLINVNLPLEQLLGQSDDHHFQSASFKTRDGEWRYYWLCPDGVRCYDHGEELEYWPIDGAVKGEAYLTQFGGYAPCVYIDDQLLYCAPDGEVKTLVDGIVGGFIFPYYTGSVFAINDGGMLAEYSCDRSGNLRFYPIAQHVVSAEAIGGDAGVIFACTDGKTYLVQTRDFETCYGLLYGNPEIAYRYCLGLEPPRFYWVTYQVLYNTPVVDEEGVEHRLSHAEAMQRLIELYCAPETE